MCCVFLETSTQSPYCEQVYQNIISRWVFLFKDFLPYIFSDGISQKGISTSFFIGGIIRAINGRPRHSISIEPQYLRPEAANDPI